MKALVFGVPPAGGDVELPDAPVALQEIDDPALPAQDWVLLRPRLAGICGSDLKQVLMEGDVDNAMTAVISFPQVLGHEVVADVVLAGPAASVAVGTRVVLNPWLSCGPRGLDPCDACGAGQFNLCHHFTDGHLEPGIHSGNSSTATGAFAELVPAHDSMCIPVPAGVSDEAAVLADPFSVSLHSIVHNPPPAGGTVLVYGLGALGTTTCAALRLLHTDVRVLAVVEHDHQADLARSLGAEPVQRDPATVIDAVAAATDATTHRPFVGEPFLHPGGVDVVYDTVGSPETLEVGVRITRARGTIAITGVATPGRFEWTPWYFKELRLVGSNAFGIEEADGVRQHAMAHYLDWVANGRLDITPILTHRFTLTEWRTAFQALVDRADTAATKVVFDFSPEV